LTAYLDASAAAKLLVEEPESRALAAYLDGLAAEGATVISSALLETELRRLAVRTELAQSDVSNLLERVDLVEPDRSLFHEAGILPGAHLRSLDALHVATALRVEASMMVAYDDRQREAAEAVGLRVIAPA